MFLARAALAELRQLMRKCPVSGVAPTGFQQLDAILPNLIEYVAEDDAVGGPRASNFNFQDARVDDVVGADDVAEALQPPDRVGLIIAVDEQ